MDLRGGMDVLETGKKTLHIQGLDPWTVQSVANQLWYSICLFLAEQPPAGQGLLIHEVSMSHNDVPQSVGPLWTSDQPVAETST
jgi:hypothetical protein